MTAISPYYKSCQGQCSPRSRQLPLAGGLLQLGRLGQDWQKGVRECDSQTQEAGEQGLQLLSWHCHGSAALTLTHMAKDTHSAPQVFLYS